MAHDVDTETPRLTGRYVYGIARGELRMSLGDVGLEGRPVYSVAVPGICAVVHKCPPEAYWSADEATVLRWIASHNSVVELACRSLGTVIPVSFNTILCDGPDGDLRVALWLEENRPALLSALERLEGRREYVVEVSLESLATLLSGPPGCPPAGAASTAAGEERELPDRASGPGTAYLVRLKSESERKAKIESAASRYRAEIVGRIQPLVDDLRVEPAGDGAGSGKTLVKVSCLLSPGRLRGLRDGLAGVEAPPGVKVRLTGPWPPYSFSRNLG